MASLRIVITFLFPIFYFSFATYEDVEVRENFYEKLCNGEFDNESSEERIADTTFKCQSENLPEEMRNCILDEFNVSTYPANVSMAKSIVCNDPLGCQKFNQSVICVQDQAAKMDQSRRDNYTSTFLECLKEGLKTKNSSFEDDVLGLLPV